MALAIERMSRRGVGKVITGINDDNALIIEQRSQTSGSMSGDITIPSNAELTREYHGQKEHNNDASAQST